MVDQPGATVPQEHVWVARSPIDVRAEGVEPDDVRGSVRSDELWIDGVDVERPGQEVDSAIQSGASRHELVDLRVGLGPAQRVRDLDQRDLRDQKPEPATELTDDDLRDQRFQALTGSAELRHVESVVVSLDQPWKRASFTQRSDIASRGHRPQHAGIMSTAPVSSTTSGRPSRVAFYSPGMAIIRLSQLWNAQPCPPDRLGVSSLPEMQSRASVARRRRCGDVHRRDEHHATRDR